MTKTVRTLTPEQPSKTALELMMKYDIGAIVIVEGASVVGIVTERDVVKQSITNDNGNLKKALGQIASKPVTTATPNTKVWDAFALMLRKKIRRLPVVEKGKLVGIVTERDLFKWVVRVVYEPNIPDDLKKLIEQSA